MNDSEKRLIKLNGIEADEYAALVDKEIRLRYSISDEIAILRQRDTKPDEFAAYNAYAEECKAKVKEELEL